MQHVVGVYLAVALVVVVGGAAKVREPVPFAASMRQLGLRIPHSTVRLVGLAEVALGVAAFVVASPVVPAAIAAAYLLFAGVVWRSIRAGAASCGCFGAASAPPSWLHVGINVSSAVVAVAVAISADTTLLSLLDGAGSVAVAIVVLIGVLAALIIGLNTAGAELVGVVRSRAVGHGA